MILDDLPESEDIEDRRDDEAYEPTLSDRVEQIGSNMKENVSDLVNPSPDTTEDSMAAEAGYNAIPNVTRTGMLVGPVRQRFARGGPASSLKRLDRHPVFPKVHVVHKRIPGLVGSSRGMSTIAINSAVPTMINVNGKRVPTAAPLAVRELYTRAGCEVFRETAQKAGHQADERDIHSCADEQAGKVAEAQFLREKYGFDDKDLAAYARLMAQIEAQVTNQQGPGG